MPTTAETITEYFAAIRTMDVDRYLATFAEDGAAEDPVGTPLSVGPDALRAFFAGICGLVDAIDLAEDNIFLNGNSAAVKWTGTATGKNGKHVTWQGVDVLDTNAEGKITLVRAFWNPGPVMAIVQS
jgi:steroid delta-isomerase